LRRAEGAAKIFGVFRVKNHDFTPKKNHIFSNFRGGVRRVRPPLDPPLHTSLSPKQRRFAPGFVNYKKGALDSQPQVIKLTSCLPMVGGSLRLPPPPKLIHDIAGILLKVALNTINQSIN
jgi:hypothetical protein